MAFTNESSKQKKFSKTAAAFAALVLVLGMIPIAGMAWAWGEAEKEKALEAEDVAGLHDDQALMSTSAFVPVVDDKRVFIGIVTRKDILAYLGKKAAAQENGVRGMDQA